MFISGRDPTGLAVVPIRIEVQSSAISAMIAAYSKDIILPGVTLVGREYSRREVPVLMADGTPMTLEARQKIAATRKPKIREDGTLDFREGTLQLEHMKVADDYLPKSFRVLKARELETPEGEKPKDKQ